MRSEVDYTAKADRGKPELMINPWKIVWAINKVRMYGNEKYGDPDNWKTVEVYRFYNALLRHMLAVAEDPEGLDKESGLPHIYHVACNVAFIIEKQYDILEARIEAHERNMKAVDEFVENIDVFTVDSQYIGSIGTDDIWYEFTAKGGENA